MLQYGCICLYSLDANQAFFHHEGGEEGCPRNLRDFPIVEDGLPALANTSHTVYHERHNRDYCVASFGINTPSFFQLPISSATESCADITIQGLGKALDALQR